MGSKSKGVKRVRKSNGARGHSLRDSEELPQNELGSKI